MRDLRSYRPCDDSLTIRHCTKDARLLAGSAMDDWQAHFVEKSRRRARLNLRQANLSRMLLIAAGIATIAVVVVVARV